MSVFTDVKEFHEFFGHPVSDVPGWLDSKRQEFRIDLIEEEFKELNEALAKQDMVETADAMADLIYVIIGFAVEMGIPLQRVWQAVQTTNMAKGMRPMHDLNCKLVLSEKHAPARCSCGAVGYTETGKTSKPAGWTPPNKKIKSILDGAC